MSALKCLVQEYRLRDITSGKEQINVIIAKAFFHSSEVFHLPCKCVSCTGPHSAKECHLACNDPIKCANCGGDHLANWTNVPASLKSGNNHKSLKSGNSRTQKTQKSSRKITPYLSYAFVCCGFTMEYETISKLVCSKRS
ncbi:hypothetical protein AVEN_108293-1 [Araneus ventricosus]|uniref:Uncharacterized protein n=1 Tax=Araneus ventricosus TaxID=182803 RepID=A0A4Y2P3F6_ARAVE|nr:hypothetical protein AVEN_108293-1 [Araneus ventricosus]